MKKHLAIALLACAPLVAGARCLPLAGKVELAPDPDCTITSLVDGPFTTPRECYAVRLSLRGLPDGAGFAGITNEGVVGSNGVPTVMPVFIPEDNAPVPRQIIQTARSAIDIGKGAFKTRLYSSDVIVMRPTFSATGQMVPEVVTEQILITGTDGRGAFASARGHLVILGNSIGQKAQVVGELCGS